jgi:poly(A) polymerase
MREIWMMQPRFERRSGSSAFSLVEQPRFRAGFDFLRLRTLNGDIPEELAHWWETFSLADDAHRRDMLEAVRVEQQRQKTGARRVKATPPASLTPALGASEDNPDSPPVRTAHMQPISTEGLHPLDDDPRWRDLPPDASLPGADDPNAPVRKRRRRRRKPTDGGDDSSSSTSIT